MKRLNEKARTLLAKAIGAANVIVEDEILDRYARDETSDLEHAPDILVRVSSAVEASRVLRICNDLGVPVTPRGAGTGVTGGAVPVAGGVVLSLERMNRILEIDERNMTALVEPGVITGDLQRAASERGLMYPPDPASLDSCSIGGNVAEGAGGPRAVKYGTTKDYVLGLEFVLPDGGIINTGGKFVKNATGFNLCGLLTGSEGTLAVITKILLRLIPAAPFTMDLLLPYDTLEAAVDDVYAIIARRVVPAALEFMEEDAIRITARHLGVDMPFPDARAHLLVQLDGTSEEEVRNQVATIAGSVSVPEERIIAAESRAQSERIWKARRTIREAITAESPVFLAEDTVVPRSEIPVFLKKVKEFLNGRGLRSVMFGHAGDGNVHIDVLMGAMSRTEWDGLLPVLKKNIYATALAHGGTITGEHGIGYTRREYLGLALGDDEIALLKRIKTAFDPRGILNPRKIFGD
ncbi:MAG TPA: FAD-linked oxidase C-terminal domain-containing protein [Spirochaetota bacterium]|nr:FAD-linked oxidase C-terminal domain-containing protein [Spirochaetota bacterium]